LFYSWLTDDSDLTVAALLALGTISDEKVYERKKVAGGPATIRAERIATRLGTTPSHFRAE
jgi:hypothetical protein